MPHDLLIIIKQSGRMTSIAEKCHSSQYFLWQKLILYYIIDNEIPDDVTIVFVENSAYHATFANWYNFSQRADENWVLNFSKLFLYDNEIEENIFWEW